MKWALVKVIYLFNLSGICSMYIGVNISLSIPDKHT